MPRSCAVCEHPERETIDRALVGERRAGIEADLRRMAGMAAGVAEGEGA